MDTCVVHGDVKPQNALVFEDATGKTTTVKMTDFGYSTLAASKAGNVLLPKLRRGMLLSIILESSRSPKPKRPVCTRLECYAFGFCLGTTCQLFPHAVRNAFLSLFRLIHPPGPAHRFRSSKILTYWNVLPISLLTIQLVVLYAEHRIRLKEFFNATIQLNPDNRMPDVGRLVGLLS
jgi:hypothetical protein